MKRRCAKEALKYIENGMIVGLGGGSTISYLVEYLEKENLDIQVVTPSHQTAMLCLEHHLTVLPTWSVSCIDVAFDGCDEVDLNLNALKSNGAIHTKEKIIASMAKQYILLVDESKVYERLPFYKSVTLEVIPEAKSYVIKQVEKLGGKVSMRTSQAKDGVTISDHGNFIMDVKFDKVKDVIKLDNDLRGIVGIIDTSLFVDVVTSVLSVDEKCVHVIKRRI
ncbi:MAG: ribose 5-phosphate isomerase A [Succinatimonas sp.]|nr:ribose 5-phosphate isomerase A [Succinatimonas sp.]